MDVAIGGGVESISMNQTGDMFGIPSPWLIQNRPELYMAMIETAEVVGERYGVSREAQDELAANSQARTAEAQAQGKFDDEIVPLTTVMKFTNKETGETTDSEITLEQDEGNRPGTTAESLAGAATRFCQRTGDQGGQARHRRERLAAVRRRVGVCAHGGFSC